MDERLIEVKDTVGVHPTVIIKAFDSDRIYSSRMTVPKDLIPELIEVLKGHLPG